MTALIIGLVLFLGLHSTRIVADGARTRFIGRIGAGPWRGLYSLVSAVGLVLIVWGYSLTVRQPVVVYSPASKRLRCSARLSRCACTDWPNNTTCASSDCSAA